MANAVATKDQVAAFVENIEQGVSDALPAHVTKVAFCRALQTCLRKTPKLMQCNKSSLGAAVMDSAQFGLTIGYTAHLIPFKTECTLVIDYKGLIDMAYRHDRVTKIMADVVCENDEFDYSGFGKPVHKKDLRSRGKEYAAYAYCELKDAPDPIVVVMSNDEIEKVRKSSRAGASGPWVEWWGEMAKKTAIKRLCKIIPKSIELQNALEFENRQEEEYREVHATVVPESAVAQKAREAVKNSRKKNQKAREAVEEQEAQEESQNLTKEQKTRVQWLADAREHAAAVVSEVYLKHGVEGDIEAALDYERYENIKADIKAELDGE